MLNQNFNPNFKIKLAILEMKLKN